MSAAKESELGVLHSLMAEQFRRLLAGELTRLVPYTDAEGNQQTREEVILATAAELSVIRAFLKDNEITAVANKGGALDALREKLAEASKRAPAPLQAADFDVPGTRVQ